MEPKPRIDEQGELVCSDECPRHDWAEGLVAFCRNAEGNGRMVHAGISECIPGLRAQRLEFRLSVAEKERDEAREIAIGLEAWSLFEGGRVPDEVKTADWWDWDYENQRYRDFLAERRGWIRKVLGEE